MKICVFYVPFEKIESAESILKLLLENKLIACGNVFDSKSFYNWDESLVQDSEVIVMMKTIPENSILLEKRILELHPYKIPAILHWDVYVNESYYDWVKIQVIVDK